ncbi:MAG: hypothetical protein K6G22_13835 [Lachnospiraceae bacterium]|nr:hypothetical protein [Lachnospiraceae bacterium]
MNGITGGTAMPLSAYLEFDGYKEIFLTVRYTWEKEDAGKLDLGRRRIFYFEGNSFLCFINESKIDIKEVVFPGKENTSDDQGPENTPVIKIVDILKDYGVKCKTLPGSLSRSHERGGLFSENGYFLQDSSYSDWQSYACDLVMLKDRLIIGGRSVKSFSLSHESWVNTDIRHTMDKEIKKVLTERVEISDEDFDRLLTEKGVMDIYRKYFGVSYYD